MKFSTYTLVFDNAKNAKEFYTIFGGKENKQAKLNDKSVTLDLAYNPAQTYNKKTLKKYGILEIK